MPQLDVSTYYSQVFWLVICLTTIFTSLRYIFIPKIENSIRNRQRRIEKMLSEAEKMQIEAEILNKQYAENIQKAHFEATEMQKKAINAFDKKCEDKFLKQSEIQHTRLEAVIKELDEAKDQFMQEVDAKSQILLNEFLNKALASSNAKLDKR